MRLSARNQLEGTVKDVKFGNVMAEVIIDLGGGREIVSVITRATVQALALKEGDRVRAVIKSTEVMVAKD